MSTSQQLKQRTRDQIAAQIEALLQTSEPLTRTQIKTAVRAASDTVIPILERMRFDGVLGSFETKGPVQRGIRRDERWCLASRLPKPEIKQDRFRGAEILVGFQLAAREQLMQGQRL
jgi:hypothetical protein